MSLTVGELQVLLSGDTRPFNRDLDSLDSRAGKTESIWSGAFKKIALTGGAALATLGVASFLNDTKKIGIEYTNQLNTLQAVSGATAQQMADVGKTAKVLGSDLTLPATSAADAAAVMTELAKAGFTVADSQTAAKGALQLAAAAQIEGAQAATIQANAINAFSLSAADAGRVSDVLANAANASSAEITDVSDALQQASAVAAAAGISIEDTAAAIGILANNGIKGSDAGTLLKSALLALQSPSEPASKAMQQLGLDAYDAAGNFVGLSSVFGQLSEAQKKMTPEAYAAATSTLFGSDAARLAGIAGKEGAAGFDAMRDAMGKQGAAADVAAAKAKGLGGAIEGFKSQVETFQIDLFERASPNLEKLVRFAAEKFPQVGQAMFDGMDAAVGYVRDFASTARDAFEAVAGYVRPVTSELDDLYDSLTATNGPLDAVWGGLKLTAGAALGVANALHPVVQLAGAVLGVFNSLPGPIQTVVIGLAALKVATSFDFFGKLVGRGGIAGGFGAAGQSVVGFGQTVKANMALADESVGMVSRTAGGLGAAFQTYLPGATGAIRNFTGELSSAYTQAKLLQQFKVGEMFGAGAIAKSTGDLAGLTAAAKTAATQGVGVLRSAAGGLVGFMGGPWGIALAGAAAAIGFFSSQAAESKQRVQSMAQAMMDGTTAVNQFRAASEKKVDRGFWEQVGDQLTLKPLWSDDYYGHEFDAATKKAKELYDALTPLGQKQQDVTFATNNLQTAIATYGANSPQAVAAAASLRGAQSELAGATDEVTEATKTQISKLNELANLQLAQVNSSLAAQQSQFALTDQINTTNAVLANQDTTADQAARSLTDLAQQAINNAQAQGKAAADQAAANGITDTATFSNLAMLRALEATAQQMGVNTPASITTLIASLSASGGAAALTSQAMSDLGIKVTEIPGEKFVRIDAPTAEQQARIEGLGGVVRTLPDGHVYVFANTADAEAAVTNFVNTRRTIDIEVRAAMPDLASVQPNGKGSTSQRMGTYGAAGGIVHAYAAGGFERLTPMQGGIAQMVKPNTFRVIGDRVRDDEAYIPINGDARSLSILSETARRMGGQFLPNGAGLSGATGGSTGTGSGTVIAKHYNISTVVREVLTEDQIMRAVRQSEAIYG